MGKNLNLNATRWNEINSVKLSQIEMLIFIIFSDFICTAIKVSQSLPLKTTILVYCTVISGRVLFGCNSMSRIFIRSKGKAVKKHRTTLQVLYWNHIHEDHSLRTCSVVWGRYEFFEFIRYKWRHFSCTRTFRNNWRVPSSDGVGRSVWGRHTLKLMIVYDWRYKRM